MSRPARMSRSAQRRCKAVAEGLSGNAWKSDDRKEPSALSTEKHRPQGRFPIAIGQIMPQSRASSSSSLVNFVICSEFLIHYFLGQRVDIAAAGETCFGQAPLDLAINERTLSQSFLLKLPDMNAPPNVTAYLTATLCTG
jgi:hypothetical protein